VTLLALAAITACTETDPAVEVVPTTPSPAASVTASATAPTVEASAIPGSSLVTTDHIAVHVWPSLNAFVLGTLDRGAAVEAVARARTDRIASDGPQRWLALGGLGWAVYEEASFQLPSPFEALPRVDPFTERRASPPLFPPETRTGVPAVDRAIEAVTTADFPTLESLVFTYDQPCGQPPVFVVGHDNPDQWPCDDPNADAVRLFHVSLCEGERQPVATLPAWIRGFFDPVHQSYAPPALPDPQPLALYAALDAPSTDGTRYRVIFAFEPGGVPRTLSLDAEGRIRVLGFGCGPDPVAITLGDADALLRPNVPPPLRAPD
jgi:hypothetical protein